MDIFPYSNKEIKEVLADLGSDREGLASDEARSRLKKFGPNRLVGREVGALEVFIRQLKSPFIYLLLAAVVIALLLHEFSNAWLIVIFVVISTVFGFYQEYRSEQTVKLLKQHFAHKVAVLRDGREIGVDSQDLVPGEVIFLKSGDIVPADARLMEVGQLLVDESALTGESESAEKVTQRLTGVVSQSHQAKNLVFSGTTVVAGRAKGLVLATGKQTSLGAITKLTGETQRQSVFEKEIKRFSQFVLRLVIVTVVLMFGANLLLKGDGIIIGDLLLFSIALAVSVIPEALPLVTTFSFSRGALRLAKKQLVVKRLSSVEDLGAIEVLCTDKTGTLTENKMTVGEIYSGRKEELLFYASVGVAVEPKNLIKNPFDLAIFQALGKGEKPKKFERIGLIPFDPQRRRDTTLVARGKRYELISRGAPETMVNLCRLSRPEKEKIEQWVAERGKEGQRVLAIGKRALGQLPADLERAERELDFLGLISFFDPIKKTALEAIVRAEKLGVAIKIITGDRKEVAQAVAEQIGLVKSSAEVISGEEFASLSTKKQHQLVEKIKVFARVSPLQKYQIIQLLEEKHEVGFLGDGINDAPAMKLANVALGVKGAADVAREAADIVLLKKDLKVIVDGIKEGREIFVNTTKYITTTLAANFGNFYAVAAASLLVNYLPLLPVQILLLNLLSDLPMISIATDKVDSQDTVTPRKYELKSIISLAIVLGLVSSFFDFMTFAIFSRWSAAVLQTNWFMESILTELVFVFSARTRRFFLKAKAPSLALVGLSVLAALITVLLPWLAVGRSLFAFVPPRSSHLLIVFSLVGFYFVTTEVIKLMYFKLVGVREKRVD